MADQPDLYVSSEELDPIATAARDLHDDLAEHGRLAEPDERAAAEALSAHGFATGRSLTLLAEGWSRQVQDLQNDCAHISGHLDGTVTAHAEQEFTIQATLQQIQQPLSGYDRIVGLAGVPDAPQQDLPPTVIDWGKA
ncbi:hypothetical protein [Streptomyces sp. AA0539]|uniref:hypothetical protein n=1 Tax=Streptomyces sp. AA0539 TaxID=1210045 RepID=UPI0003134BBE|nr:hypothetical protein [Streptomyces sp. AA0539]